MEELIHRLSTESNAADSGGGGGGTVAPRRAKLGLAEVEKLFGIPPRTFAAAQGGAAEEDFDDA